MNRLRALSLLLLLLIITLCLAAGKSDGSRRPAVHADIWLRNEAGEPITPSDNAADPYSPKKTCGACHHYPTITQGDHFRMGSSAVKTDPAQAFLPPAIFPGDMGPAPYDGTALYDWVAENSHFHPGGGPMERISLGKTGGTPPEVDIVEAERIVSSARNPHFRSRITPDGRSHFKASGTLEAECLMCHMGGYSLEKRNAQVASRNYRWAATAGAGLGEIRGKVFSSDVGKGHWDFSTRPSVAYNWKGRSFTGEGKLSGRLIRQKVSASSCLMCHGETQAFHTGTLHRAQDDVHVKAGLSCTDCHGLAQEVPGGRLSHRIGSKGLAGGYRKTGLKTCITCHLGDGYALENRGSPAQAPNPTDIHAEKLPNASFHLRLFACTACHATSQPARGAYLLDLSTGSAFWYTSDLGAIRINSQAASPAREPWKPWLAILDLKGMQGLRYVPVSLHAAQWFGFRDAQGRIRPVDLKTVAGAYGLCSGITVVEVKDTAGMRLKLPTVATAGDMGKMLSALDRSGGIKSVFVSDKVYELKAGKVVSSDLPFSNTLSLPVWHNVQPVAKKQTYGAKGCTDCHGDKADFFTRMKVRSVGRFLKEDYPNVKGANAYPQMQDWGYEEVPSHE